MLPKKNIQPYKNTMVRIFEKNNMNTGKVITNDLQNIEQGITYVTELLNLPTTLNLSEIFYLLEQENLLKRSEIQKLFS